MRAFNLIRREPHYRHEAFSAGLAASGYEVVMRAPEAVNQGDVLCVWNRYGGNHDLATRVEKAGGIVLVAENGYLGTDESGRQRYALARHAHNGAGDWPTGDGSRWQALGIDLAPWRADGGHVLVCPNRSFGMPGTIMPPDWGNDVCRRLAKLTKREIRLRPHPGNNVPKKPLEDDLADAWACVIWSSSAGVHALVAGIPVICEAPKWICKAAAGVVEQIEAPPMPNRLPALQALAWAQYSLAEIESGMAFKALLACR